VVRLLGLGTVRGARSIQSAAAGHVFSKYNYIFAKLYHAIDTTSRLPECWDRLPRPMVLKPLTLTSPRQHILNAITDASYGTIYQNDYVILWAAGFANERNQNQIQCTQGNNVINFDDSDGVGLYYQSNGQINVNLASVWRRAPGL